jgi:UDP-glucose 4-epimerase
MEKTILIVGGAGFVGSHLADRLITEGYSVAIVDNLSSGVKKNVNNKARFYKIDICNSEISDIFEKEKPKIVFHLAAQIDLRRSVENPIEDANINILGSLNVLDNCIKYKIEKIVFASSGGAIYGDADIIPTPEDYPEYPLSPYGINKLTVEKYLNYYYKIFGLPFVSLRFSNIYGPRQNSKGEAGVVAIFCDKMLSKKQPIIYGNGEQTRDFVYVEDVVDALVLAINSKKIGIFNIGSTKETDINTIFEKIRKIMNSACEEVHIPAKIGEQKRSCLDCHRAKNELGWEPKYNLEKGLEETVKWFTDQKSVTTKK